MKPKIFVASRVSERVQQYLDVHTDCEIWGEAERIPREVLLQSVTDKVGLITSSDVINQDLLDRAPQLKAVSTMSVGYNHFDIAAMKARNVIGSHTPYVLDDTVADLIFALILAAARRVPELDRYVKQGRWKRGDNEILFGVDVHHHTLGIIGMGRIGEAVAKRARLGFDMEVLYHNRSRRPQAEQVLGVQYIESFDEILSRADFILVMTPLTPKTENMFNAATFSKMKTGSIFINASRGKVVEEDALVQALRSGKLRGAGLDVFRKEPIPLDHPLLQMEQVVTLPHIGSATSKTREDMAMLAAENLLAALNGNPQHVVAELK